MGIINYFRILLQSFFLLLLSPVVTEGFEISIIGIELPFGIILAWFLKGARCARAANGHASLCMTLAIDKYCCDQKQYSITLHKVLFCWKESFFKLQVLHDVIPHFAAKFGTYDTGIVKVYASIETCPVVFFRRMPE